MQPCEQGSLQPSTGLLAILSCPCSLGRYSLERGNSLWNLMGRAPCNRLWGSSQPLGNSLQPQTVLLATLGVSLQRCGQGSLQPSTGLLATLGCPLQPRTVLHATLELSLQSRGQRSLQPCTGLLATLGGSLQPQTVLLTTLGVSLQPGGQGYL